MSPPLRRRTAPYGVQGHRHRPRPRSALFRRIVAARDRRRRRRCRRVARHRDRQSRLEHGECARQRWCGPRSVPAGERDRLGRRQPRHRRRRLQWRQPGGSRDGERLSSRTTVLTNDTPLERAGYAFRATSRGTGNDCCGLPDILWTADFNRDGKVDIATIDATLNGISVFFADGPDVVLPVAAGVRALRLADVNADGNADLLYVSIGGTSATVGVFIGDGRGHFTSSATTAMMNPFVFPSIAVGDLNRDGRPNLVSVGADATRQPILQLLLGRGDSTVAIFVTGTAKPVDPAGPGRRARHPVHPPAAGAGSSSSVSAPRRRSRRRRPTSPAPRRPSSCPAPC